ncbi:PilT/PilU family type 4a pilus ATPase [Candidatus Nomurabacteria bacterium]|nr:PilT/PilU family type 4a pilus ATPase [Candidatus Nomurabacteria bacterium]
MDDKYKQLFESLIDTLIQQDGSDLHLAAGRTPALRVNGELIFLLNHPELTSEDMQGILKAILSPAHYERYVADNELDFSYNYQGSIRLRGNAFVQQGKQGIALRLIPHVRSLEELHLPSILGDFARKRQGFFLVVGPVGQGKSSTMASMVSLINQERPAHVLTIEDPIEYVYESGKSIIDQREVGIDTKGFEHALKSAFREDVNVILIGEMRTPETISTAVTAAETGHLVLSTLHTNNASQTIDRIIDSFPAAQQEQIRVQLASSLLGIFSQRLVPRIAGGRVPVYELLINNNAVANLIREGRTHEIDMVIETGFEQGMVDMNRSLVELVRQGEITPETAFSYSLNPKNLERLM